MIRQKMTIRLAILFLLLGTSMAWSQRQHKKNDSAVARGSQVSAESKISPRYSDSHKASHGYILHEDDHRDHHGNAPAEEYIDSEDQNSHKEQEEAVGNEELDKTVKDDEYDDQSEKGGHHRFEAGGASFDKHLKDHKADNKEIENIKQHDAGEKFGGQATKDHKLGTNKEKSKGHKLHGFKNVYHKEEYGDHKTFHDEFLDSDHQNNYDDHHEHQEMEGGKFSKGFKHEGKNKKYDKGDEKREWGKEEYDSQHEGKHEKGGQSSKHRHGSKKHQGQYDANVQRNKNSVHKIKKGTPPPSYVHHGGHHGPHQAQIQPYVHQYNSHHEHAPSHHRPQSHSQSHHVQYDDDKYKSTGDNGGHHQNHENHHGSHAHNHGGHKDHDQSHHYSQDDDDDHESDYKERTVQNHRHRSHAKEQLEDKSDDKITHKQEPVAHKQSVSSHYGTQQYRQPVYQEKQPVHQERQPVYQEKQPVYQEKQPAYQERFHPKQPEYSRQDKYSHPFNERSHNHNHRIRYGFQPRNYHHHSHHQHQNQHQEQLQPFPRFPGHNHHHGHHHHGYHKNHYSPMTSHYQQEFKPDVHARKTEHASVRPSSEDHRSIPQKHYE